MPGCKINHGFMLQCPLELHDGGPGPVNLLVGA